MPSTSLETDEDIRWFLDQWDLWDWEADHSDPEDF